MTFKDEIEKYKELLQGKDILLYGALHSAEAVVRSLQEIGTLRLLGCAVTSMGTNPKEVYGVPVREIDTYAVDKDHTIVIIATMPIYFKEIKTDLQRRGYPHVLTLSGKLQNVLFRIVTHRFLRERLQVEQEKERE